MKKTKILIVAIALVTVLCIGLFGAIKLAELWAEKKAEREAKEAMEVIEAMEREKMLLYQKVNHAVHLATNDERGLEVFGHYIAFPIVDEEKNAYGIWWLAYMCLKYYEKGTGTILSYETIVDYFSEEYEPDGSLRLYNNGLHPEMEVFVDWMWEWTDEVDEYWRALEIIYGRYFSDHIDEGFEYCVFYSLSPQMYDELAKKEADPEYEMDLMSLHQQGY